MSTVRFAAKPGTEPTLEAAYQGYREACYGTGPIPERQEFETRQAFVAGIVWLFGFMQNIPETEEGFKQLDALELDIRAFGETLRATAKAWEQQRERVFPVQHGGSIKGVPWAFMAPHDAQARRNHDQSLERLAERHGCTPCEILAIVEGRAWRRMDPATSEAELVAAVQKWREIQK